MKRNAQAAQAQAQAAFKAATIRIDNVRTIADAVPARGRADIATLRAAREQLLARSMSPEERRRIMMAPLSPELALPTVDLGEHGVMQRLAHHRQPDGHYRRLAAMLAGAAGDEPEPGDDDDSRRGDLAKRSGR